MRHRLFAGLICLAVVMGGWWRSMIAAEPVATGLFARKNLVAWCIVPFDSKKRGPEERAAMLEKLGFTKFAYDYRAEHIPTFDAEIEALKKHHVELFAWWFPTSLNDEAKMTLEVFAKHRVTPQLWVTGGGGPTKDEADQKARVVAEAARIRPIAEAAAKVGCKVALYNHGGWFGEPENQIAIIQELKLDNVGIVYNQHHGHDHLDRFPELLQKMKPHLYTLNLNGMVKDGERKGQKILQLGEGELDLKLLKVIRDSGYTGPMGILGHTQDDAEERLRDNLDGLDWLLPQVSGKEAGPKPKMRTPVPRPVAAVAPPAVSNKPLVEGKFGQALDGRAGGAFVAGRDEFRQFPLTVECWTRLADKSSYNILVAHEQKSSGTHWEIFSMAGSGTFTAYLPGFAPDHCNSTAMICDNRWHHVAMVLEPERVRLYVDGMPVADQKHKRSDRATEPGGLALASLVDKAIGCSGLVDEVRISKGVRSITAVPDKPFVMDDTTVALWHLDELVEQKRLDDASPKKNSALLGNAAVTQPAPAKAVSKSNKIEGHWGEDAIGFRWTEADSRDDRFGKVDSGSFFCGSITGAGGPIYKGIVIRLGDKHQASVCYDTELMRTAAGWMGHLVFDPARFGIIVPPKINGDVAFATPRFPGVSLDEGFKNFREANAFGALPKDVAHYKGLYRHGQRFVLKFTAGPHAVSVLESPWLESAGDLNVFTRTWRVEPSATAIRLLVADPKARVRLHPESQSASLTDQPGLGSVLVIAPHDKPITIKLLTSATDSNEAAFEKLVAASPAPEDLVSLTKAGPKRWGEPLVTKGEVTPAAPRESQAPYVVDTITLPFDNPFNALFFCAGHDFFPDGRAAICTLHGDVWLVDGIDDTLQKITWRRFATGLFQPLGLKIVDGLVYVTGRDQITRLHDLNGDGEADVYENFNNDAHVTLNGHEYVTCLETDRAGNFYYIKGNSNSQIVHDGSLLRVSKDGSKLDVFATGFRNSNGIGMGPNDEISVAPQEGEWTPASGVFLIREGKFYGGMMSHHQTPAPTDFERPIVWFPRLADNSSGGQVWTTSDRWGPLSNQLLHMSYGQCRLRLVLRDAGQLGGIRLNNGISVELPMRFYSGIHRGRMNPHDGQLYLTGLKGWTTSAVHDGCFQRVRYTGAPVDMPIRLQTYKNGVALTFTQELDRASVEDVANFQIEAWNYKWSAAYGSPEYKPSGQGQVGRDEIEPKSITLLDRRTVFIELPDLKPVDQLSISYSLLSADRKEIEQTAIATLNSIARDAYPEKDLHRPTEDPERAKLVASLVPGVNVQYGESAVQAQRLIAWDCPDSINGVRKIVAKGWVRVPVTGRYLFSADGSKSECWITVGQYPRSGISAGAIELSLTRGLHPILVEQHSPGRESTHFRLMWESKRFPRETVPATLLMHQPSPNEKPATALSGSMLFAKHHCANCHVDSAPGQGTGFDDLAFFNTLRAAPSLEGIGSRIESAWIARWIREPHRLRTDTTMPAVIPAEDRATTNDIAAYLATLQVPVRAALSEPDASEVASLEQAGEELYERLGCIACHTLASPEKKDEWQRVTLHFLNAKFRYVALVDYLLTPHNHHISSRMPDFRLTENEARSLAQFLRRAAQGKLDDAGSIGDAERGRIAFGKNRCAQCHVVDKSRPIAQPDVKAIPQGVSATGCLATEGPFQKKAPRFAISVMDQTALVEFLSRPKAANLEQTRSVDAWLSMLRCTACHARDARQPIWPEIAAEEGSGKAAEAVPQLTWVGEKLQGPWIEKFLKGEVRQKPRPWITARMPAFPAYASVLAHGLAAEHGVAFEEPVPTQLDAVQVEIGQRLTLREGLDCRQCHGIGKEQPRSDESTQIALGINFAMTRHRLRPEFALRQMLDPPRYDIGSRMPRFAPDLKTTAAKQIEGGDAKKQFEMLKEFLWSLKDQ